MCPTCTQKEAEQERRKTEQKCEGTKVEYITQDGIPTLTPIRILQWNADSLLSNNDEFKSVLKKLKVDIFLVQETKMTTKDKLPAIPGYTLVSKPRKQLSGMGNNKRADDRH